MALKSRTNGEKSPKLITLAITKVYDKDVSGLRTTIEYLGLYGLGGVV